MCAMRMFFNIIPVLAFLVVSTVGAAASDTASREGVLTSSLGNLRLERMVDALDIPWSFEFLPEGGVLIAERDGRMLHVTAAHRVSLKGLPVIADAGQGGLLDILLPRDFALSRQVYFTFSKKQGAGYGTALAMARLPKGADQLSGVTLLFESKPNSRTGRHFGSRLIERYDGTLLVTIGDRGKLETAQDMQLHHGKILRFNRDGSIPRDNPFVNSSEILPEIWSIGHRNPQGMTMDREGRVWTSEHGAKGGDEVNLIKPGANYGWPVISYGRHYSGARIGEGTTKPGLVQPAFYWDPSIAPSAIMAYDGALFPEWRGDLFVGSLKFDYIARLSGLPLQEIEQLQAPETGRIRDVQQASDGSIWFASETEGALFRLSPMP